MRGGSAGLCGIMESELKWAFSSSKVSHEHYMDMLGHFDEA